MNKFEARSTLGSEAVPVFDDDGELTECQHEVCAGNDEADYSDIFCTESDVIAHEIIR